MNRIEKIFSESERPRDYVKSYFGYLTEVFESIDCVEIETFIETILKARQDKKTVYFIGNGGSAATASHFANDLAIGTRIPSNPFKVVSLTDNNAVMTAIANDFGYESLFVSQLEVLLNPGDVVVAISASGNSPNIIKAIEYSNSNGAKTVGITGFDGGKLREVANMGIHVPSNKGEYGPVEDLHMIFDHIVGTYLAHLVKQKNA